MSFNQSAECFFVLEDFPAAHLWLVYSSCGTSTGDGQLSACLMCVLESVLNL